MSFQQIQRFKRLWVSICLFSKASCLFHDLLKEYGNSSVFEQGKLNYTSIEVLQYFFNKSNALNTYNYQFVNFTKESLLFQNLLIEYGNSSII